LIVNAAVRLPGAEGAKFTLAVQLDPGATELAHVFVRTKSAALGPVTTTLEIFKVALPLLVKVMLWAVLVVPTSWLLNVTLAPLIVRLGAETGGGVTGSPPPPQEVNKRTEAMQNPAKIAGYAQCL